MVAAMLMFQLTRAKREAAMWRARLRVRRISNDTIERFFAWRRDPENAEAFDRLCQARVPYAGPIGDGEDLTAMCHGKRGKTPWSRRAGR